MRIGDTRSSIKTQQHSAHASPSNPHKNDAVTHSNGAPTSIDIEVSEGLKTLIQSSSQIRESVVAEAKSKLQNGDYFDRSSAIATAKSILNA